MLFLQWNINGVRTRFEELKLILNYRDIIVASLQETHLLPVHNFSLRGYQVVRNDSTSGQRARGGVMLIIKDNVYYSPVALRTTLEAVAVEIHVPRKLTICSLYIPPDRNITEEELTDLFDQMPSPILMLGDFNAHSLAWGSSSANRRGRLVEQLITDRNIVYLNDGRPTYVSSSNGAMTSIDLSLCSPEIAPYIEWTVDEDTCGSDHFPIYIELSLCDSISTRKPKWITSKANWDKFKDLAQCQRDISSFNNENDIIKYFNDTIIEAALHSIPKSSPCPRRKPVPWWNEDCQNAIRERKRAIRIYKRHPTEENLSRYKQLKAKARQVVRHSKRQTWQEYVSSISCFTPATKVWQKVRGIIGTNNYKPVPGVLINGQFTNNPVEVSNHFGEFYSSVSASQNYTPNFLRVKQDTERTPLHIPVNNSNPINRKFSVWELENALKSAKRSAPGNDGIIIEMLLNMPQNLKNFLLASFNYFFTTNTFPNIWRESLLVPILKPQKDRAIVSSYRPISLTSVVGKVMEKMAANRLWWYIEKNKLLTDAQSGFRKRRSTTDHLINLEQETQNAFRKKEILVSVFFDMEHAFDTVWRRHILTTLIRWGVDGNMANYIENFLKERTFRVQLGPSTSQSYNLENGVPQGSVLSVLLFNIAINDITSCIEDPVRCLLYADDFVILSSAKDLNTVEINLQSNINKLQMWCSQTGFKFSPSKTKCMMFTRRRNIGRDPCLQLFQKRIEVVQSVRFLGVIFDQKLRWVEHIKDLKGRCLKLINIMRALSCTKWGADRVIMLRFYNAFIRSRLDYGSVVYSSARQSALNMLNSIHNGALRLALGAFRSSPAASLCVIAGELPLSYHRDIIVASHFIKYRSFQTNPICKSSPDELLRRKYCTQQSSTKPFVIRAEELLNNLNITLPAIATIQNCPIPPWLFQKPNIFLGLTELQKSNAPPYIYHKLFLEFINMKLPANIIYTDGSKSLEGVGAAVVSENKVHKISLRPECSAYMAELYALRHALNLESYTHSNIVVCTDSLSALLSLYNLYTHCPLAQDILCSLRELHMKGNNITFCWIPGHTGIKGNEVADSAAKEAALLTGHDNVVIYKNVTGIVNGKIWQKWQSEWLSTTNKLRYIKECVKPWPLEENISRREDVLLNRLRIGHTRLTHGYLMSGNEPSVCHLCQCPLTVRHILSDCVRYRRKRRELDLPDDMKIMLGLNNTNTKRVLKFLEETRLSIEI